MVLSLVLAGTPVVLASPSAGAAEARAVSCVDEQLNEAAARAMVAVCGRRVEVLSERTEFSQTFVNPDGSFTFEESIEPVRVRQGSSWVPVDTTLKLTAQGVVAKASVLPVVLSPGGDGPLARLSHGDRELSMSWPTRLPVPVLEGDTAIYRGVLGPDVDLRVTVSPLGFSEVLVVRTREAAVNPALASVRFGLATKGVTVSAAAGGGLVARDAQGGTVFEAPPPLMWDSPAPGSSGAARGTKATPDAKAATAEEAAEGEDVPDVPGGEVQRAVMPVRVADGELTVTPDRRILSSPATTFPVFIDPAWTGHVSGNAWTSVWSKYPTSSFWRNSSALLNGSRYGSAGAGRVEDCDTCADYIIRSFFRMDTSKVRGTHVLDAKFRIEQRWSWTCSPASDAKVWMTSAISSATTWRNMPKFEGAFTARTLGNRAYGSPYRCKGVGTIEFNVTKIVDHASKHWSAVTLGLRAIDEGTKNQWKRFNHASPRLAITYNRKPNPPTSLSAEIYGCRTGASRPYVLTATPTLSAKHSDPDGGSPRTDFYWWPLGGARNETNKLSKSNTSGSSVSVTIPSGRLSDGGTYVWQAHTYDGVDFGGWSGTCEFTVDATPPPAPGSVASTDYPSTGVHGGVGIAGVFNISAPTTRPHEVVAYAYSLDSGVLTGAPTVSARTGGDYGATVTVRPLHDGVHTLYVWSKDHAGRFSATARTYTFTVRAGAGPAAEWSFDEASGDAVDISRHGNTATLAAGATRTTGRAGVGTALSLGGGSTAYASTSGPVMTPHPDTGQMIPVRTDTSFTVTAWVRLTATDPGTRQNAVGVDGVRTSAFKLGYTGPDNRWRFLMLDSDVDAPTGKQVVSDSPPTVGKWTHLAATYDASTKRLRLYVNGVPQASTATLAGGFNATGGLAIGRSRWAGGNADFFHGAIDDVRFYPFVETAEKLAELARPLPPAISFPNGATVLAGGQLQVRFDAGGDTNVTKFRYSVDGTSLDSEVSAAAAGGTATVTVNAGSVLGGHPIYAVAVDDGNRLSELSQAEFTVNPAASLNGMVLDESEFLSTPVAGAMVTLEPGGLSTVTDANGAFSFASLAPGHYTLSATFGGPCGLSGSVELDIDGMGFYWDLPVFRLVDDSGNTCSEQTLAFTAADQSVVPLSGDDATAAVALPFAFPFYGQAYRQAWVDTNGLLLFTDPGGSHPYDGSSLPDGLSPDTLVAPFWDDLVVDASASVRTAVTGTGADARFTVEWRNVHRKASTAQRLSFEVILAPDGTIVTDYTGLDNDAERGDHAAVGIESPAGADGLTYSAGQPLLDNNKAIVFDAPDVGGTVEVHDLSGALVDAAGAPVVGATITVDPSGQTTVTGAGGAWSFTGLVADSYTVSTRLGGRCAAVAQTQVDLSADTVANLQLGPDYGGLGYACTEGSGGYLAGADAVFLAGDDEQTQVGLPFPVPFHGHTYTEVTVNTNGYAVFGDDGTNPGGADNQTMPDPARANAVAAPFWDDLSVDASAGVYTRQVGTAPDRQFVIEWRNALIVATGERTTFELVLGENGRIAFHYTTLSGDAAKGASATVGLESASGTAAAVYSTDEAALTSNQSIVYTPAAPGTISGTLSTAVTATVVAGATVTLHPTGATTTTDADGGYQFTNVPPGEYTVQADTADGRCAGQYAIRDLHHTAGVSDIDLSVMVDGDEFGYTCQQATAPFLPADQVIDLTGDDNTRQMFPPFPIKLYGATHTTGWVDTNGLITFRDPGGSSWDTSPIPSQMAPFRPNAAVYPFWDDLIVDEQASVRQSTVGSAPNRQWIIEWRNVRSFEDPNTRLSFEVIFAEGGDIDFRYADIDPANAVERGAGATIGIEDGSGTLAFQYAHRQAWLATGDGLTFHQLPPGQGSVSGTVSCEGAPVGGATVTVAGQQATTAVDGTYTLGGIAAGPHAAIATVTGGACAGSHPEPVTVGTAATTTVDFPLDPTPAGGGYTLTEQPTAFVPADDTVLTELGQKDDGYAQISLPFPVTLYGQTYSTAWVDTNGVVTFTQPTGSAWNHGPIPSAPAPNQADAAVYPLWHDWVPDTAASVRTATIGTAPNRQFIVEWRNVHSFLDDAVRVTFEVIFHEAGGYTFAYADMDGTYLENGGLATIGLENADGTAALQYTFRHPVLRPGMGVHIAPPTP
jgi:hypothetical protein